jgi:hypothetical protein
MPGRDRTGPHGAGPRTGRQMGSCAPEKSKFQQEDSEHHPAPPELQRKFRQRWGWSGGHGRGFGHGGRHGRFFGRGSHGGGGGPQSSKS